MRHQRKQISRAKTKYDQQIKIVGNKEFNKGSNEFIFRSESY
jgi:hypothetical protein